MIKYAITEPTPCRGCDGVLRPRGKKASDYTFDTKVHQAQGYCSSCYDKNVRFRRAKEREPVLIKMVVDALDSDMKGWVEDAACLEADPEFFFSTYRYIGDQAKRVYCNECPVKSQCLRAACESKETYGIWGGLSDKNLVRAEQIYDKIKAKREKDDTRH